MKTSFHKSISIGAVLAVALLSLPGFAQQCKHDNACDTAIFTRIVVPHFTIGGFGADVNDFNSVMTANGYKRLKDYSYQFGGGFYSKFKRLLFNWELTGTRWPEGENRTDKALSVYGLNGSFTMGVDLLKSQKFAFFPFLGAGMGRLHMELANKKASMNDVLTSPVYQNELSQKTVILEGGLGFDYTFAHKFRPERKHVLGIRAGYAYDPSKSRDWKIDRTEIENGPSLNMSGPYVKVVFGRSFTKHTHIQKWEKKDQK